MEKIKINNQKDILKIGLTDMNDKPILDEKGEVVYWEFDLTDVELLLKYQQIEPTHKKNVQWLKNQLLIIEKRQDVKGKSFLSKNEEDKVKAIKTYYQKEAENINTFLGKKGVEKFLNGRNYYFEMFDDIADVLEEILPIINKKMKSITALIKEKYKKEEENVLE